MNRSNRELDPAIPAHLRVEVLKWRRHPRERPAVIPEPGPGQESVWAYPRPPRVELERRRIRVLFGDVRLADSTRAWRVLETANPPVYYLPPGDVAVQLLSPEERTALCEWKGVARYWTAQVGTLVAAGAAWSYPEPFPGYEAIAHHFAFMPRLMSACLVGGTRAQPQPGQYYGGWVTPDITGPFKGEPGSENW